MNENTVLFLQVINEVGQESGYPQSTQILSRVYKKLIARGQVEMGRLREVHDLLVHRHEIKVVPGLNDFSILDADNCNAGELDWRLSRLKVTARASDP